MRARASLLAAARQAPEDPAPGRLHLGVADGAAYPLHPVALLGAQGPPLDREERLRELDAVLGTGERQIHVGVGERETVAVRGARRRLAGRDEARIEERAP